MRLLAGMSARLESGIQRILNQQRGRFPISRSSMVEYTLAPLGIPEYLGGDKMMDDFCLDEDAGVAYVTTHRENTIDQRHAEPESNSAAECGSSA